MDIFEGQEVDSAEGERVGIIARLDTGGFDVRADFLDASVRCGTADIAARVGGVLKLSLTRDQLRERAHPSRRVPGDEVAEGGRSETSSLRAEEGRNQPGSSPTLDWPPSQGGERLDPADEEPQGGDRLATGNDASSPLFP